MNHGRSEELIARHLCLTMPVLQHELETIYKKLGVVSRVELLFSIYSGQANLQTVNQMTVGGEVDHEAPRYTRAA